MTRMNPDKTGLSSHRPRLALFFKHLQASCESIKLVPAKSPEMRAKRASQTLNPVLYPNGKKTTYVYKSVNGIFTASDWLENNKSTAQLCRRAPTLNLIELSTINKMSFNFI